MSDGVNSLPLDTIICGDNCDVLGAFPRDCIDLVVTSPPYGNLRTYGGHSWDFEGVASQLWRVTKSGGVVVWVVADATVDGSETGTSFRQALRFKEIGFRLHDTMIWDKGSFSFPAAMRYHPVFEFMFVFSNGAPRTTELIKDKPSKFAGMKVHGTGRCPDGKTRPHNAVTRGLNRVYAANGQRGNVWLIPNPGKAGTYHPATFPEALARDHILSWSNEGDIVLDPFNGSGTTTKMAREMGRRYIGIEINTEYCDIARKRLEQQLLFGHDTSATCK
jgi:site-specific DNA-methyltransferase (adenine-specific)